MADGKKVLIHASIFTTGFEGIKVFRFVLVGLAGNLVISAELKSIVLTMTNLIQKQHSEVQQQAPIILSRKSKLSTTGGWQKLPLEMWKAMTQTHSKLC